MQLSQSHLDDDWKESSMWVKGHIEKSALNSEWSARARAEKHALTSALLKIRGKLRDEHQRLLRDQQTDAIEEEENHLRKRLRDLVREVNRADLEVVSAMLKSFQACMLQVLGDDENVHEMGVLSDSSSGVIKKLYESSLSTAKIASRYMEKKRSLARQNLLKAVASIQRDVEIEGENYWKKEVARVTRGWQPDGEYGRSFKEQMDNKKREEAALLKAYVSEQEALAHALAGKEMRDYIRTTGHTAVDIVRTVHNRSAQSLQLKHDRVVRLCTDMVESGSGDSENQTLAANMVSQATTLQNRLNAALEESAHLFESNLGLAAEIASLRQVAVAADEFGGEVTEDGYRMANKRLFVDGSVFGSAV
jgi:hypothetical protein